jgi:hypothetical protein
MGVQELYERDFFEWTQRTAELLNQGRLEVADIRHIAEELEDLGKSDQREVESYLRRLIMHLLKWQMQPSKRGRSWLNSIIDSRASLQSVFKQSPSLKRLAAKAVVEIYPYAVRQAAAQTGLSLRSFPTRCPYRFDELMDPDFIPGA